MVMAAVTPHISHPSIARLFLLSRNLHNPASDFCSAPRPSRCGRYRDQHDANEFTRVLKHTLAQSSLTPFRDTRFGQTPTPWTWWIWMRIFRSAASSRCHHQPQASAIGVDALSEFGRAFRAISPSLSDCAFNTPERVGHVGLDHEAWTVNTAHQGLETPPFTEV